MKFRSLALILALWVAQASSQEAAPETAAPVPPTPAPAEPAAPTMSVEEAYLKEFAFLEAQRRQLEQRIADTRGKNETARAGLEAQVNELQNAVVRLDSQVDRANEQLGQSEEQVQANADNREVLAATFQQAGVTLEQYEIKTLESESFSGLDDAGRIEQLFGEGRDLASKLSSIRTETGPFYTTEGTEVTGDILRVGNIAAFGRSAQQTGLLAPAGGERLKIWPVEAEEATKAVFSGSGADVIPVFLYESLAKEVEVRKEKGPVDVVNDGGTIGWVIVVLGMVALILIILRGFFLKQASASTEKLADSIARMVRDGNTDQALAECKKRSSAPARVVAAAVRNLDRDRDHIEDIVSEAILHESGHLNRFGTFILVVAAVAPLLGLLGTVTGMISTFDIITEFGTGDPKLLSGGIAIALVTTELGLIVAIPTLLVGNLLSGWAERIKDDMERAALHIINVSQDRRNTLKVAA